MTDTLSPLARIVANALETHLQSGELEVPMLPEVAGKVVSLCQSPDSDAADLAKLIQADQSLAGHFMRIANSSAYSPNASLVSLQQAIARLGMNLIGEIALTASISTKMFNAPGFEQHIDRIWQHALLTALWSKEIARTCRRNVEATFLCGLLHSIGRPTVLQAAVEAARAEDTSLGEEDAEALESAYQAKVGVAVAARWGMPKIVCEAIGFFDNYNAANTAREQATMVSAGARFATHTLVPESLDENALLDLQVLSDLNLYQDEVAQLLAKKDQVISTKEAMLA